MENPFSHNRAINIIGRVLDQVEEEKKDPDHKLVCGPSLEARIGHALEAAGLLSDKGKEIVGLAGRFGHPEVPSKADCPGCQKDEHREWTEPEEHTCGQQNG